MTRVVSARYTGRRAPRLVLLLALLGWLIFRAVLGLADLAERLYVEAGRPNWGDIVGGVIFLPIAVGIAFSLALGRTGLLQLVALLPQGIFP